MVSVYFYRSWRMAHILNKPKMLFQALILESPLKARPGQNVRTCPKFYGSTFPL